MLLWYSCDLHTIPALDLKESATGAVDASDHLRTGRRAVECRLTYWRSLSCTCDYLFARRAVPGPELSVDDDSVLSRVYTDVRVVPLLKPDVLVYALADQTERT